MGFVPLLRCAEESSIMWYISFVLVVCVRIGNDDSLIFVKKLVLFIISEFDLDLLDQELNKIGGTVSIYVLLVIFMSVSC